MKKLLKLALIVGAIAAVSKLVTAKKAEWQGLSEAEVREKLGTQLPGKMPDEKRDAVAEKVVSKMREHGVLREEDEAADVATDNGNAAADSDPGSEGVFEVDSGSEGVFEVDSGSEGASEDDAGSEGASEDDAGSEDDSGSV